MVIKSHKTNKTDETTRGEKTKNECVTGVEGAVPIYLNFNIQYRLRTISTVLYDHTAEQALIYEMYIMQNFILWALLCGICFVGDTIIILNAMLQPKLCGHYFQLLSVF
jgi:hypothetical protein